MMKRRKRKSLFALALALMLVLSACGNQGNDPAGSSGSTVPSGSGTGSSETSAESTAETSTEAPTAPTPSEEEMKKAALSAYYEPFVFITAAESLNIRRGPSTYYEIVGALKQGFGGKLVAILEDGKWYHIQSGPVDGYVSADFILTGDAASAEAMNRLAPRVKITGDSGPIHAAADTNSEKLAALSKGTVLAFIRDTGEFYEVGYADGKTGFIPKSAAVEDYFLLEAGSPSVYPDPVEPIDPTHPTEPTEAPTEPTAPTEPVQPTDPPVPAGHVVCIDPGHQARGITDTEPVGPGASEMKQKLTTGTAGCVTGKAEYEVNLEVSLKLQAELEQRGYRVIMVRTTNECPMSNAERALFANQSGAEIFIRVHCNSLDDGTVTGVINYAPSLNNPYMPAGILQPSIDLATVLGDKMCQRTGAKNRGVIQDDGMTGINWAQIPVAIVEMGFMSNPDEDRLLSDDAYQWKLAGGMADGVDAYFSSH